METTADYNKAFNIPLQSNNTVIRIRRSRLLKKNKIKRRRINKNKKNPAQGSSNDPNSKSEFPTPQKQTGLGSSATLKPKPSIEPERLGQKDPNLPISSVKIKNSGPEKRKKSDKLAKLGTAVGGVLGNPQTKILSTLAASADSIKKNLAENMESLNTNIKKAIKKGSEAARAAITRLVVFTVSIGLTILLLLFDIRQIDSASAGGPYWSDRSEQLLPYYS